MLKQLSSAILLVVIFAGCETVGENRLTMMDDRLSEQIQEVEILILRSRFDAHPQQLLESAGERIEVMESTEIYNKDSQMRIQGLKGYISALSGRKREAENHYLQGRDEDPGEVYYYLTGALLADTQSQAWAVLEKGLSSARDTGLILLAMGDWSFLSGDYLGASVYYEEALLKLPRVYSNFYKEKKALAFDLQDYQGIKYETTAYLTIEELTFSHLLALTLLESSIFDEFVVYATEGNSEEQIRTDETFSRLIEENYFSDQVGGESRLVERKDLALLFYKVAELRDPHFSKELEMMSGFNSQELSDLGAVSPIEDVAVQEHFFAAVVYAVEREFLELPDGINFFPFDPVTGLDYYGMLKRVEEYYKPVGP